ncbi:response regulator transcription factor [Deinococcus ruber]|uniref:response regulator transcription factor n=1 Tax=Deinococcus ruber TaxID=1848197 RepID=UPI00166B4FC6|nr:response regulator transcription factor [Deinococcus ruber]
MFEEILILRSETSSEGDLEENLKAIGYSVHPTSSITEAMQLSKQEKLALILLDDLCSLDNYQFLAQYRGSKSIPIIVLSSETQPEGKVLLLNQGAADYVEKPYDISELIARIKIKLRSRTEPCHTLGDLKLYLQQRQIMYRSNAISLSHYEFEILTALLEQPGQLCSRTALFRHPRAVGDTVKQHQRLEGQIKRLRLKLQSVGLHGLIQTVRGRGYRLKL